VHCVSFLLNASEHYVGACKGAWAPRMGSQALAEGEIPCLWCSMPWRVSIALMYVLSLAMDIFPKALRILVIRYSGIIALYLVVNLVACFSFAERNLRFVYCHVLLAFSDSRRLFVGQFISSPGIDVDARHCPKQLPRRHSARSRRTRSRGFLCLRALCLGSTRWLGLTCLGCITWRLGLA
jgi:hypothetical protein